MVEHVIVARVREEQRRRDLPQQVDHLAVRGLVEHDFDVGLFEAVIRRIDFGGGGQRFAARDGGNFRARQCRGAAVAGGYRGDVDLPAGVGQADERAGAEDFGVVRDGPESVIATRREIRCQVSGVRCRITHILTPDT